MERETSPTVHIAATCVRCGARTPKALTVPPIATSQMDFSNLLLGVVCAVCGKPVRFDPEIVGLKFEIAMLRRDLAEIRSAGAAGAAVRQTCSASSEALSGRTMMKLKDVLRWHRDQIHATQLAIEALAGALSRISPSSLDDARLRIKTEAEKYATTWRGTGAEPGPFLRQLAFAYEHIAGEPLYPEITTKGAPAVAEDRDHGDSR